MTAAAPERLALRVTLGDTWDVADLAASPDESVGSLKVRALAASRVDAARAGAYEVKVGGVRLHDESRTLREAGLKDGSAIIVQARRRRAVR